MFIGFCSNRLRINANEWPEISCSEIEWNLYLTLLDQLMKFMDFAEVILHFEEYCMLGLGHYNAFHFVKYVDCGIGATWLPDIEMQKSYVELWLNKWEYVKCRLFQYRFVVVVALEHQNPAVRFALPCLRQMEEPNSEKKNVTFLRMNESYHGHRQSHWGTVRRRSASSIRSRPRHPYDRVTLMEWRSSIIKHSMLGCVGTTEFFVRWWFTAELLKCMNGAVITYIRVRKWMHSWMQSLPEWERKDFRCTDLVHHLYLRYFFNFFFSVDNCGWEWIFQVDVGPQVPSSVLSPIQLA